MLEKYQKLLFSSKELGDENKCVNDTSLVCPSTEQKSMEKCVLLSMGNYYNGASGLRTRNLARLLSSLKEIKTVVYMFSDREFDTPIFETGNITFISLGCPLKRKNKYLKVKENYFLLSRIRDILLKQTPKIVYVYSTFWKHIIKYIKKVKRKMGFELFFDVVELRKKTSISLKQTVTYNFHNNYISKIAVDQNVDGVSCPTSYLKEYFEEKRHIKNVFLLPITMEVPESVGFNKNKLIDKITFLYAGTPDNKRDLLAAIIEAFTLLPSSYQEKCLLIICGISPEKLIRHEGLLSTIYEKSLCFSLYLNRIPKKDLYSLYPNIDFSLLLKDSNKEFSKAGFPTKMSESFSFGVPMISNISGDIGVYLKDGVNGYISKDFSAQSFCQQLRRAIDDYDFAHNQMVNQSFKTAKEFFEVDSYVERFQNFLK